MHIKKPALLRVPVTQLKQCTLQPKSVPGWICNPFNPSTVKGAYIYRMDLVSI